MLIMLTNGILVSLKIQLNYCHGIDHGVCFHDVPRVFRDFVIIVFQNFVSSLDFVSIFPDFCQSDPEGAGSDHHVFLS